MTTTTSHAGQSSATIPDAGQRAMLRCLADEPKGLTAKQLGDRLEISQPSTSRALGRLLELGYIQRAERQSGHLGRPSHVYRIAPQRHVLLGIYIEDVTRQASHVWAEGVALDGERLFGTDELVEASSSGTVAVFAVVDTVERIVNDFKEKLAQPDSAILGVAVALGGHVENGVVKHSVNVTWSETNLQALLEQCLPGLSVWVQNDATVLASARNPLNPREPGSRNLVVLINREGIGGGVYLDGRPWLGAAGAAGEIGHTPVPPDCACTPGATSTECPRYNRRCGHHGCLEGVATPSAIARTAGTQQLSDVIQLLSDAGDANRQRAAKDAVEQAGRAFGLALAGWANLLSPARVLVVGPLELIGGTDADGSEHRSVGAIYRQAAEQAADAYIFGGGWRTSDRVDWEGWSYDGLAEQIAAGSAVSLVRHLFET